MTPHVARRHPTLAEVDAMIDVMDREEPQERIAIWRPPFETLSAALPRARRVRSYVRAAAIAVTALALIALHRGEWSGADVRGGAVLAIIVMAVTEVALAKIYAALGREQRIVSLLRYFGSSVADEEVLS